ncbi:3-isopropylmalate dehydratase [bacterium]|nr:3-isopropylmalate dehydratase [bacterium]
MKETKFKGRLWIITEENGQLFDDVDTDMIYHNAHLAVTDINEMGQYAFGNLTGWENFHKKVQSGDVVLLGRNFGSGSSRQHPVDCFEALGVAAIVAESYGSIYKRNAINAGFPILTAPGVTGIINANSEIKTGHPIELDLESAEIRCARTGNIILKTEPFSKVQMDVFQAGNIFEFGKTL